MCDGVIGINSPLMTFSVTWPLLTTNSEAAYNVLSLPCNECFVVLLLREMSAGLRGKGNFVKIRDRTC